MKQNPKQEQLRENLKASKLAKEGFLGEDTRPLQQIIEDDLQELEAMGLTAEQLAGRMEELTALGLQGQGVPVEAEGYSLQVEEFMGRMPCPFRDGKRLAKRNTSATRLKDGAQLMWTDVGVHLIGRHGFFQGLGSPYRLEPVELARFLNLQKKA